MATRTRESPEKLHHTVTGSWKIRLSLKLDWWIHGDAEQTQQTPTAWLWLKKPESPKNKCPGKWKHRPKPVLFLFPFEPHPLRWPEGRCPLRGPTRQAANPDTRRIWGAEGDQRGFWVSEDGRFSPESEHSARKESPCLKPQGTDGSNSG